MDAARDATVATSLKEGMVGAFCSYKVGHCLVKGQGFKYFDIDTAGTPVSKESRIDWRYHRSAKCKQVLDLKFTRHVT